MSAMIWRTRISREVRALSWQSVIVGQRLFGQLRQIGDAGIGDETEFG
ncbi:hypothetical protein [Mesorhizobium australicum]